MASCTDGKNRSVVFFPIVSRFICLLLQTSETNKCSENPPRTSHMFATSLPPLKTSQQLCLASTFTSAVFITAALTLISHYESYILRTLRNALNEFGYAASLRWRNMLSGTTGLLTTMTLGKCYDHYDIFANLQFLAKMEFFKKNVMLIFVCLNSSS
jgi:hypothetical protein